MIGPGICRSFNGFFYVGYALIFKPYHYVDAEISALQQLGALLELLQIMYPADFYKLAVYCSLQPDRKAVYAAL